MTPLARGDQRQARRVRPISHDGLEIDDQLETEKSPWVGEPQNVSVCECRVTDAGGMLFSGPNGRRHGLELVPDDCREVID
jgi:hypothetical protein